jgi:hypothetical protein
MGYYSNNEITAVKKQKLTAVGIKCLHSIGGTWMNCHHGVVVQWLTTNRHQSTKKDNLWRKLQQDATMYQNSYYSIFIWSSTCFGRHTAHHQEPKTVLVASGFSYVEGCWTCSWWMLSGTLCLTTSTNLTPNFSVVQPRAWALYQLGTALKMIC